MSEKWHSLYNITYPLYVDFCGVKKSPDNWFSNTLQSQSENVYPIPNLYLNLAWHRWRNAFIISLNDSCWEFSKCNMICLFLFWDGIYIDLCTCEHLNLPVCRISRIGLFEKFIHRVVFCHFHFYSWKIVKCICTQTVYFHNFHNSKRYEDKIYTVWNSRCTHILRKFWNTEILDFKITYLTRQSIRPNSKRIKSLKSF